MKRLIKMFYGIFAVMVMAVAIAQVTGFDVYGTGAVLTGLSMISSGGAGVLYAGLNKEIWLPEILEHFFPDNSWLKRSRDLSAFVENDKINLAEAGVMPEVLINNTTYPIPIETRDDIPISLELDYFDTKNTVLRNAEKVELSYDKRQSLIFGHKQSLQLSFAKKAIHGYAPQSDSADTPVIATTGDVENGFKKITLEDILNLYKRFNKIDAPDGNRVLVLNPEHEAQLMAEDLKLFKEVMKTGDLFGFKVFRYSKTPVYDITTGEKKAFGAAAGANDTIASVAWVETEVMRAVGTMEMFSKDKDPEARGDILGFQMRGIALPIRNKAIAAIYSDNGGA